MQLLCFTVFFPRSDSSKKPFNMDLITKFIKNYNEFALTRPEIVSDIETGIRWMSYFVPSKSRETAVLSELLFCSSKLLALFHDNIYERYINGSLSKVTIPEAKIFKFIKVVHCVEVFIEISSAKFGGTVARWIIIAAIQLIKVICRFTLIYKYNYGIVRTNSIAENFDRKAITEYLKNYPPLKNGFKTANCNEDVNQNTKTSITSRQFVLKSTGRVIQSLAGGSSKPQPIMNLQVTPQCPQKVIGEMIYTLRPLVHLASLAVFGQRAWMPWLTSCGLDICSIYIVGKSKMLQPLELRELNHRTLGLFVYLIRSPFYSTYSKRKILGIVERLKRILPIGNAVWTSIASYAELWDQIYFYSWDS